LSPPARERARAERSGQPDGSSGSRSRSAAAPRREHLTRHADSLELFLPWRNNDQDARGTRLWLPKGRTDLLSGYGNRAMARSLGNHRRSAVLADLAAAAAVAPEGHKRKSQ
jgi:hypothetical protein